MAKNGYKPIFITPVNHRSTQLGDFDENRRQRWCFYYLVTFEK